MGQTDISPLACVHPNASVGVGVRIDPFVVIEDNVVIGDGVHVQAHSHLRSGARIGNECIIYTGASIGAVPQDLKFRGEETTAQIGDRTIIREYVTVHRGTTSRNQTVVGSDCLLMAYCHIAHDCIVGDHVILANAVQLGGHAEIGDWVIVGGLTGVHQFERIGKHAIVGAGFRVMKDVPPYAKAGNQPLGYSGINTIGLRRRGFSEETITLISNVYRLIYQSGYNIGDGLRVVEEKYQGIPEVVEIVEFFRASERGVISLSR